jgi:hypothetical protein
MEKYFVDSKLNPYYMDVSLEEGWQEGFDFFASKGVKPSLYATQMARINGFHQLAMKSESYQELRNKVSIKNVYYKFNSKNKTMEWNPIVPPNFRF